TPAASFFQYLGLRSNTSRWPGAYDDSMNGPSATISDGGVATPIDCAKVPALRADSNLCFGTSGTPSNNITPGPYVLGNVTTTVFASGAVTLRGCPLIFTVPARTPSTLAS